ncbi:MAG: hypothetical protein LKE36_05775 [Bacilli bacterium]|nr:hypothetical protein [Bacilli bacterium]
MKVKETLLENMSMMALFSAINVIAAVITAFLPISGLFLLLFLPLVSTVVTLYGKIKYYPIYSVATLFLSFFLTMQEPEITIFYIFPSLLVGLLFGYLIKRKIASQWIIIFVTILQTLLTAASLPIIKLIYEIDMVSTFLAFFHLATFPRVNDIVPLFILIISLVQTTFTFMILSEDLPKIGIKTNNCVNKYNFLFAIGFYLLSLISSFIYQPITLPLLLVSTFFGILTIIISITIHYYPTLVSVGVSIPITLVLIALSGDILPATAKIVIAFSFVFFSNMTYLFGFYLLNRHTFSKM